MANTELLLTNIGFVISIAVCFALGIFVFLRRPEKDALPNIVFFFFSMAVCVWQLSYFVGINLHDPNLSRLAFMFNLATLYLNILFAQLILIVTDRYESRKKTITIFYIVATFLTVFYSLFPDTFLLPSVPRLYLPNFMVPGSLYEVQDLFFYVVMLYFLYQLAVGYHRANAQKRNQLVYIVLGLIYGYITALAPEFLLYGYSLDPVFAAWTGLYTLPLGYTIIRYNLVNVSVFAKRALGYALGVTAITLFILLIGRANEVIAVVIPDFPVWIVSLFSGLVATAVGVIVWKRMKEVDILKYQFIDVVTHKFRTPLTHIRWSLESLRADDTSREDRAHAVGIIAEANQRLNELTNMLVDLSGSVDGEFMYEFAPVSLNDILNETLAGVQERLRLRNISIHKDIPANLPSILIDKSKFEFATQTVIENAIIYSKDGSSIDLSAEQKGNFIALTVRDHGMGIIKADMDRMFAKFFRSNDAMHVHTEGLGIGLYLSREIMLRHSGNLSVQSDGPGKGAVFTLKIPIER